MHPYLLLYKTLLPRRYRRYLERAGGNTDMCHEALLHGTFYEEYKAYDFASKNEDARRSYLTDAVRDKLCRRINCRTGERIVANKWLTYKQLQRFYHRRIWLLEDSILDEVVEFASAAGYLVVKPADSCGGRGVQRLACTDREEWRRALANRRGMVAEECIQQDAHMARWNPSSVNTVRINTILRNGEVSFFTAFLRTGRAGSFVDNGLQGGIFANIDTADGLVTTDAYDELPARHPVHPDSMVPFRGERIPQWDELTALCRRMAQAMPHGMTYVGWDMALTPCGWEPVEANRGEFIAQQITLGHGLRHEFERLVS
ncbi:MAG: hypothetical protein IJU81_07530 [Bacteroidales bacterium]|nr:hypothetical protein [Bacteroidales bacterium]